MFGGLQQKNVGTYCQVEGGCHDGSKACLPHLIFRVRCVLLRPEWERVLLQADISLSVPSFPPTGRRTRRQGICETPRAVPCADTCTGGRLVLHDDWCFPRSAIHFTSCLR